ncbi:MAG: hypothetical protein ABGZ17_13250 [Planctomycetaceae bacterium]
MSDRDKPDEVKIGFLTAVEITDLGFVGGLLVTNQMGRPLEFQCTAPVKPNRAQIILFGPTLTAYVSGELIGRTLLDRVGIAPDLVLTEQTDILKIRPHLKTPVACLNPVGREECGDEHSLTIRLGRNVVRLLEGHQRDLEPLREAAKLIPDEADLREPFQRVCEALKETLRAA